MLIRSKFRLELVLSILGIGLACMMSGCCAPTACGDCDGAGIDAGPVMLGGPLDGLRRMKRNLVCGSGCGEVYVGEWRSTPPDACDPCQGGDFVGGATPCRPFCGPFNWRPGALASRMYGVRFCNHCGQSFDSCGCGGSVPAAVNPSNCSSCSVNHGNVQRSVAARPVTQQQVSTRQMAPKTQRSAKPVGSTISGRTLHR